MVAGIEEFENGQAGYIGRKPAWHVLGTDLGVAATKQDVLRPEVLGWKTYKLPLEIVMPDGNTQKPDGEFMIVRDHKIVGWEYLAKVGKRYRDFDNEELVDFSADIVAQSGSCFETAGSLFGGKRVFVSIALPRELSCEAYGVNVKPNLVVTNSHDGSSHMEALISTFDVVCWNTLNMAQHEAKARFKIRHTTGADMRLEEARKALKLTWKYLDKVEEQIETLIEQKFWEAEFEAMVKALIPDPAQGEIKSDETIMHLERERATLLDLRTNGTNSEFVDTAWGAYGAVTEYADWYAPIRAKDHTVARAERVATGAQDGFKAKALSFILDRAA